MDTEQPQRVAIEHTDDGFRLSREGQPYLIKGARTLGSKYMDRVAARGGNAVRIGFPDDMSAVLDRAYENNLSVLVGLPVTPERDGFDYDDTAAVAEQHERLLQLVRRYRDHPAILMWAIGNELDHIPDESPYNPAVWDAVNELAAAIHDLDPNHLTMTVVGTGNRPKLEALVSRCPDVDVLGINSYGDIDEIPDWVRAYNWDGPYAVTEWGPTGHWQQPKTRWGVTIEETSTEKANCYRERYESVIAVDPWCVGSYAFLWTSDRQEHTFTWYNMYCDGRPTGAVDAMEYCWTGHWPDNRCPEIHSVEIEGSDAYDDIELDAQTTRSATVDATDPDGDPIDAKWELYPELEEFADYAGHGESKPDPVPDAIIEANENDLSCRVSVPNEPGRDYRLYVFVTDAAENMAVANLPFHVAE